MKINVYPFISHRPHYVSKGIQKPKVIPTENDMKIRASLIKSGYIRPSYWN